MRKVKRLGLNEVGDRLVELAPVVEREPDAPQSLVDLLDPGGFLESGDVRAIRDDPEAIPDDEGHGFASQGQMACNLVMAEFEQAQVTACRILAEGPGP